MSKTDSLLKKAEFFEKLALYGSRKDFLKVIAQGVSYPGDIEDPQFKPIGPPAPPASNITLSPTVIGSPIDKSTQRMLSDILVPLGKIMPLKIDGELGDMTRKALSEFQKAFGVKPTLVNIQKAHKGEIQPMSAGPVNLDDAAKSREEYYRSQSIPPGMPGFRG